MTKYIFFTLCLFGFVAHAQRTDLQDSTTLILKANLDYQNNQATPVATSNTETRIIKNPKILLMAGDIIIEYELDRKKKGFYNIQLLEIKNTTSKAVFALKPEYVYGHVGNSISRGEGLKKRIVVANTPQNDNIKWLSGEIEVKLKVAHYAVVVGKRVISCDLPPELSFSTFTPELIIGGLGLGTLSVGLIIDRDSDRLYQKYQAQDRKIDADPIYETANAKHQDAFITKAIGIGILVGGLISTAIKFNHHRLDKKYYDIYCRNYSIQPFYDPQTSFAAPNGRLGLSLQFAF